MLWPPSAAPVPPPGFGRCCGRTPRSTAHATIGTAITAGADVSVTVRMDPAVKTAIASIPDDAWETIGYPNAVRDEATGRWISKAEVAEVTFTAFRSRKKAEQVAGRLVVRRIPDLNPTQTEQPTLFDTYRHHAFFTTTDKNVMDTVAADKTHRGHAIIEQVHADLKNGPLAHLPSGVFTANSAWLVLAVIAFNLTRTAGIIADHAGRLAKATTATIRRALVSVPARLARSARRIILHLPDAWPWERAFDQLFTTTHAPPHEAAS
jgi:Transposase DDE domain group 1